MSSGSFTSFTGLFGGVSSTSNSASSPQRVKSSARRQQHDDQNVFQDPEWFMEPYEESSASSDSSSSSVSSSTSGVRFTGSFAGLGGMSPCMGVPPMDFYFFGSHPKTLDNNAKPRRHRRRHLSFEDDALFDDSSSSTDSSEFKKSLESKKSLNESDLNPIKSFINDLSYQPEDKDDDSGFTALQCLDHSPVSSERLIPQSIVDDFETRLRAEIEAANNGQAALLLPQGLLNIVANHVLQEAVDEPYGIRGCLLHINFEGSTALHRMTTFNCSPGTPVKTFELTLTLREGQTSWGQRMARRLSFSSTPSITVSTSYRLVKKRMYRNDLEDLTTHSD